MKFFDTHFHLSEEEAPASYVEEASGVGVVHLLAAGVDFNSSLQSSLFATGHPGRRFFAAGVHPHEAENGGAPVSEFERFMESDGFAAFGEVGLDYYYGHSERNAQLQVFAEFAELSARTGAPLIVHCRSGADGESAFDDAFGVLSDLSADGGRFVLHCFTGDPEEVDRFSEIGAFFGVAGIITFKKADNIRESVPRIPEDKLLLETDAPWLAPIPFRGKSNHSKYLPLIADAVAAVKGRSAAEIAEKTTANALELFTGWKRREEEK